MIRNLLKKFNTWLNRPMTQHEFDTMMAQAGITRKRCPHCGGDTRRIIPGTGPR